MSKSTTSFLNVPPEHEFSLQNLPYGVFKSHHHSPRIGVAIGDWVLDLACLEAAGLLEAGGEEAVFDQSSLNGFMQLGRAAWTKVRQRISRLLSADESELRDSPVREEALIPMSRVELMLPVAIGDYTDFYSSRHHATNVGTMIRGTDNALQENWLHLPVAYHGRASSIVLSGAEIRRPQGQLGANQFGPSRALDFELEVGYFIGKGNELGGPIPISQAREHLFGLVLVNDWSARDLQKWEYVPLGPFLSKSFATSISPWVVPLDALEPFFREPAVQEPSPLPYLTWADDFLVDLHLEVCLTPAGGSPETIVVSNFRHMYWTMAQQLAHHTVAGCNLRPGDLLASGTVSGPERESRGCLLELTWRGEEPLQLADGGRRVFLEDGDELTIRGWCQAEDYRVGLGSVSGKIRGADS